MARQKILVKSITLLLLIIILIFGGLMWFDYLGVVQLKTFFAPIYKVFGLQVQNSTSVVSFKDIENMDLDNDRFEKRLESLDIRTQELDKREEDIKIQEENNAQIALELQEKEKAQEEREKTFNNLVKKYDDRSINIEQIVLYLNGMAPEKAVEILLGMDDQDIIDVLRRTEEEARKTGESSMGAYWLSLMPAQRAAELNRKMANKPVSID